MLVRNVVDRGVLHEHRLIVGLHSLGPVAGAEGRVGGEGDALLLRKRHHVGLLQVGVQLNLVHLRRHVPNVDQVL